MKNIRIICRADDAGMNRVANQAIRSTVTRGVVRNISLLACGPDIEHAAHTLGDLAGRVDFGLHFCLTCEWANLRWGPLARAASVSSLVLDDGTFPPSVAGLADLGPQEDQVLAELTAQYERLLALGFAVRYLDEHMFVGNLEGLTPIIRDFAKAKGLICNRDLLAEGRIRPLPCWDGPGEHPGTELADSISSAAAGSYLLVGHPAIKGEEMQTLQRVGQNPGDEEIPRNRQRRMFSDIEIVDYFENAGVKSIRYRAL